ncbi:hypothetical protein [Paenibacillus sp. HW567]|uniref:hypothetical protein n=1 Tax=Paenibacillus sp. HW567 TaxID=1034769 RepID=UPI000360FACB|nr:hypothetical protein [Paenibacillus sp. HW567]
MKIKIVATTLALTLALSSNLFFSGSLAAYAQSVPNPPDTTSAVTNELVHQGKLDLNNLDDLPDGVTTRDISYEEAITSIAKLQGITIEEAKRNNPDKTSKSSNDNFSAKATDTWVKEISIVQDVTSLYKPTLKIYAYYYSSGSFRQFKELLSVQIDGANTGSIFVGSKVFVGNLEAKLLNASEIWWLINGNFYATATYTYTGGLEA